MKVLFLFALVICYVAGTDKWENVNIDDDEILQVTKFAAETLNRLSKSRYHLRLVEVFEARRQVAAGKKYKVKISVRETSCSKVGKTFEQAVDCDFKDGSSQKYCIVTVLDKPWFEKKEVTSYSCSSKSFQ